MRRKTVRKNKNISRHIKTRKKNIANPLPNKPEGWNTSLSFSANLTNLNMNNLHVNKVVTEKINAPTLVEVEEVSMKDLNKMRLGAPKNKVKLTIDEEWAVEGLYKKYGINYEQWRRDHKVNTFQWTAV